MYRGHGSAYSYICLESCVSIARVRRVVPSMFGSTQQENVMSHCLDSVSYADERSVALLAILFAE